jgi:hypothetical protein
MAARGKERHAAIAGLAGGITTIVCWGLKQFANVDVPPAVAAAVTAIIVSGTVLWA